MNVQTFAEQIALVQYHAREREKELLKILRRCEWCKWDGVDFVSYKCPYCGNYKQQGHMAGCELAKELRDAVGSQDG